MQTLWTFGLNGHGQLGVGDVVSRINPQLVKWMLKRGKLIQLSCGSRFTVAVMENGQVYSWGKNDEGQLGTGRLGSIQTEPSLLGMQQIVQISCKGSHVLALQKDGTVFAWGRGDEGQLGNGFRMLSLVPIVIEALRDSCRIKTIACGRSHSVAVSDVGSVFTWGCGDDGQLGRGDTKSTCEPHRVSSLDTNKIVKVACGSRHTICVDDVGQVYSWGWGFYGQNGIGDQSNRYVPVEIKALHGKKVVDVCCGFRHSFAKVEVATNVHQVWAWGWNLYGQLGTREMDSSVLVPLNVQKVQNVEVVAMAAGGRHSIFTVRKTFGYGAVHDGHAYYESYSCGRADDGQLGNGTLSDQHAPSDVPAFRNKIIHVLACGWSHSCAIAVESTQDSDFLAIHQPMPKMSWLCIGDFDAFFAMLVQCIIQLMIIFQTLPMKCGIPIETVTSVLIPSAAASIVCGNVAFAAQGFALAKQERRANVTAQPQGINTVLIFAYMLLVMAPEYQLTKDPMQAWQVGVFAALLTGVLQIAMIPIIAPLKRIIPRAALLASTAGIALTFLSMGFAFQVWENPSIAIGPLMLVVICFGSGVKLPYKVPVGLGALLLGTTLAFVLYYSGLPTQFTPFTQQYTFQINFFQPNFHLLYAGVASGAGWKYISVILPMVLVNTMGELANIENAAAVGDEYDPVATILTDSLVTIFGAVLGNPFPTGVFIGHPVYKSMGARTGYLLLNASAILLIAVLNATALILNTVPVASCVGFLLWIGLLITAKSFEPDSKVSANHSMAVALGLVPSLAAWAWQLVQNAIVATNDVGLDKASLLSVLEKLGENGINPSGMIALSQGYLLTSIVLASTVVHVIERSFLDASMWMFIGACLSYVGAIHSYVILHDAVCSEFGFFPGGWHGYAIQYGCVYLGVSFMLILFHIREQDLSVEMIKQQIIRFLSDMVYKKPEAYSSDSPLLQVGSHT